MIRVSNLTKSYGERVAIDDLSFHITQGQTVGFLGPNGAGKTTTMKILTGYMAPSFGEVLIDGVDVFKDPVMAKASMGYLPEKPPLYMDMRVQDYLKYVSQLKKIETQNQKKTIDEVLEKTNLIEVKSRFIGHLSKGFKQRVGIAQSLLGNPKVIILDEPTVGLDPKQVAQIRETLKSLKSDHTLVISTHILSEVEAICDRVLIIDQGKIITQKSLEDLDSLQTQSEQVVLGLKDQNQEVVNQILNLSYVKSVSKEQRHLVVDFQENAKSLDQELLKYLVNNSFEVLEFRRQKLDLEDLFIQLTSTESEVPSEVALENV